MEINVVNLKKYFTKTKAIDDISFTFGSGHIFGFVGPNGAGKTTTMRILASLDDPTGGDVFFNGISLTEYPEKIRPLVGFVPDSLPLHSDITVNEYLDFFARAYGLKGKARPDSIKEVEEFTNLTKLKDKLLKSLSKGMKQRVSLGRALIHNPSVLIMDEPAAGLDPRARVELRELLKILVSQDKAILISSHILSELTEICNGAIIIERGKILKTGTIEHLVTREIPHRTIVIRVLGEMDKLHKELLQMPAVHAVRPSGKELHLDIKGSDKEISDLLCQIVKLGYEIIEFKHLQSGLEDIFMKVTEGNVQ